MIRDRLALYRDRVRRALLAAFREEHTPHEIALSFAIGIFITAMPSGGLGIGLFFLFIYWWSWVSKPAIFASVVVLNPIIKPVVYIASYQVGAFLFGTEPRVPSTHSSLETIITIVQLVLIGNLIIALVLSVLSYVTVLHLTRAHRQQVRTDSATSVWSSVLLFFRRRK